jgi:hypothetical protein
MDHWYPIQVKQKDKVGRPDIDSFEAVMTRPLILVTKLRTIFAPEIS